MSCGICPSCGEEWPLGTLRARRPDGYTICGECGAKTLSRNWKTDEPVRSEAAKLRIGLRRIEAIWNKWGSEPWSGGERTAEVDFLMAIGEVLESLRELKPSKTTEVELTAQEIGELPVGSVVEYFEHRWCRDFQSEDFPGAPCWLKEGDRYCSKSSGQFPVAGAVLVSRGAPAERA